LLGRVRVRQAGLGETDYLLPLALAWADVAGMDAVALRSHVVATVALNGRMGWVYDAFADQRFGQTLVKMIARSARIPLGNGWLKFAATRAFQALAGESPEMLPVKRLALDSSNTTLAIGDRLLLKGYRRLQPGVNPALEMGRFLTEVAAFSNAAPLAGAVEYEDEEDGTVIVLALLQGFVANQGDAWSYTLDYLKRFLDDCLQPAEPALRLAAYTEAVEGSPGYPADPDQVRVLLELFALEKACYELRYELDNRPDWVEIPLGGLCELLSLETKDAPR